MCSMFEEPTQCSFTRFAFDGEAWFLFCRSIWATINGKCETDHWFDADGQSRKIKSIHLQYRCYLEECNFKSKTPIERRDHCITEHKFPHDFRFDCNHGQSKKSNEKGNKKSCSNDKKLHSATTLIQPSKLLAEGGNDEDIELENKSILFTAQRRQFKNFRFGGRKTKTFYNNSTDYAKLLASKSENSKESQKSSTLESDQAFDDLMESLPQWTINK